MTQIISTQDQHLADIETLLDQCFGPGRLARTAERLREGNRPVRALAYVGVDETQTVRGSIGYWPLRIGHQPALLLGPMAVHPDLQGKGLGLELMQHSLAQIDTQSFAGVLLVGDLPYYQRSGFEVAPKNIAMPGPVDAARLLLRGSAEFVASLEAGSAHLVRPAPDLC
ncbi:N-acetyltransferase [Alphaproteobacteria bacterium]|nr:N-acetyltransferase [Alphaproteobacteria bacterium]